MLVGSSIEGLDKQRDIDIFVICRENHGFEREIKLLQDIEFDINYIDLATCKDLIDKKRIFILKAFNKYKAIYITDEVKNIIDYSQDVFNKGPDKLDESFIQYLRFDYTMKLEDINKYREDKHTFNFMSQSLLQSIAKDYFRINNIWVPKDKKILSELRKIDNKIYLLITSYLQIEEPIIKYEYLVQIVKSVLESKGGLKYSWEKQKFPTI